MNSKAKTILQNLQPAVLVVSDEYQDLAADLLDGEPIPTASLENLMQSIQFISIAKSHSFMIMVDKQM